MTKHVSIHLLLISAGLFSGCEASPLLNHKRASTPVPSQSSPPTGDAKDGRGGSSPKDPGTSPSNPPQGSDCPLKFPKAGYCAELTWDQPPTDQDPASFMLRFWDSAKATRNGPYSDPNGTAFVMLWMPSMGHGSARVTLVHSKDSGGQDVPGVFEGSNAIFIMPGDWDVRVQLRQGTSVREEAILKIKI